MSAWELLPAGKYGGAADELVHDIKSCMDRELVKFYQDLTLEPLQGCLGLTIFMFTFLNLSTWNTYFF